jgi:hypothetical protein
VAVIRKHRSLASWRHAAPALFVSSILLSLALIALASALSMSAVAVGISTALATTLSVYFLACVAAALLFARVLNWRTLLILPGVISVYHMAYGLGFLTGVLKFAMSGSRVAAQSRLFTALTR